MILVPDASVLLKWVLEQEQEPDYRKAIQLHRRYSTNPLRFGYQRSGGMKWGMCWGSKSRLWPLN